MDEQGFKVESHAIQQLLKMLNIYGLHESFESHEQILPGHISCAGYESTADCTVE